jgi:predicted outer membrane repeat protein
MGRRGTYLALITLLLVLFSLGGLLGGCSGSGGDGVAISQRNFCPTGTATAAGPGNELPRAYYQDLDTDFNTDLDISLYACDPDTGSSNGLSWAIVSGPFSGTASTLGGTYPDGVITYTPNPGFLGTDYFYLQVYDGQDFGNVAEVRIEVHPVLAGVLVSGPTSSGENTTVNYTATADWLGQSPTDITSTASWSENSPYCSISAGSLSVSDVPADTDVVVTASYSFNGAAMSDTLTLTVIDTPAAGGSTLFVDINTPVASSLQDGLSWGSAFDHPSKAMAAVTPGTANVFLAAGVYAPLSTADPTVPVMAMVDGVDVLGGYSGYAVDGGETAGRQLTNYSILDGDFDGDLTGDIYHVVVGASNTLLENVTIRRGNANAPVDTIHQQGAGMFNSGVVGSEVRYALFYSNSATLYGGGMVNYFSSIDIRLSTFSGNNAGTTGGAMDNDNGSSVLLETCDFLNNSAGLYGGAVGNYNGPNLVVTNCNFNGNSAGEFGGAMDINIMNDATISGSNFTGNSSSIGGAIYFMQNLAAAVTNCSFTSNQSTTVGGGISADNESDLRLVNSSFTGNSSLWAGALYSTGTSWSAINCDFINNTADTASGQGGAIYSTGGPLTMTDSSLSGNQAFNAGAANVNSPFGVSIVIERTEFTGNSAANTGGALSLTSAVNGDVSLDRVRFDGNSAPNFGGAIYMNDPIVLISNNLFTGNNMQGAFGAGGTIYMGGTGAQVVIVHSSASGNEGYDAAFIYNSNPGNTLSITNSVAWGDSANNGPEILGSAAVSYSNIEGWGGTGPGMVVGDPSFANSLLGITAASNLADAGTDLGVAEDYGGSFRPIGQPDIGAWEAAPAAPTLWYVDINVPAPTVSRNGLSWDTAFIHPQEAMDLAAFGDSIQVAAGNYLAMDTSDPATPVLAMKAGVGVYGGYSGYAVDAGESPGRVIDFLGGVNDTYLDGDAGGGNPDMIHVVTGASNAVLDGFTIVNSDGTAVASTLSYRQGGGMYNDSVSNLTVRNCFFRYNYSGQAAAMMNTNSSVTIEKSWFTDNAAKSPGITPHGGAIRNSGSTVDVTNSIFYNNWSGDGGQPGYGGAFSDAGSGTNTITNCTFYANNAGSAAGSGQTFYVESGSTVQMLNSIVWDSSSMGARIFGALTADYSDILMAAGTYPGTGNVNSDPLLTAPTSYNYLLSVSGPSPCLDAGTSSGAPADDINGTSRPQGTQVDMGAYEQ